VRTQCRWGSVGVLVLVWVAVASQPAAAATPHVVQEGETLWSIAAQSGFTTRTVAVFNGLSEDSAVVAGQTIQIPTEPEGAAALESAGLLGTEPTASTSTTSTAPATAEATAPAPAGTTTEASTTPEPPATSSAAATTTEAGAPLGHIPSPSGELHLEAGAAAAWNAMREEALRVYGVDIYPAGPLSAYRTSEEQRYLYELYLAGEGAPANPPGASSHESGLSVDLATREMRSVIDELGPSFGWGKTEAPAEWWHVTYTGG
jgi:LysM repeat protein